MTPYEEVRCLCRKAKTYKRKGDLPMAEECVKEAYEMADTESKMKLVHDAYDFVYQGWGK